MTKQAISDLLERYLAGRCSREEREWIDQWFDQQEPVTTALTESDADRLAEEILAAINERTVAAERRTGMRVGRKAWWRGVAAAIVLLAGAGYLLVSQRDSTPAQEQLPVRSVFTLHTEPGQRARLTLPDSSVIWLNGRSAIRYDKVFDGAIREVFLDSGEAFFEVQHDPTRPFVVHAGEVDTRVLGTSFNVEVANHRNEYQLTVATGKVSAGTAEELHVPATVLEAGQQLVYNRKAGSHEVRTVDPADYSAWTRKVLVFHHAPWPEVAARLSAWYGVDVQLQLRRGAQETFTARFEDPSLAAVLNALQKINKFHYTINRKEVRITD
ncbi:FecR family protein [Parapedobacter luteus]|uniref:FecR family protein n=1 Tax=Parapedobacter luteus TaxID=623280 RepID=A0A1T5CZS9_9SPHI|nr:FecR domain-containing protein [Parapedobacter luteus]SKB64846.1 FecR family protein [Parapedobacter luteus]